MTHTNLYDETRPLLSDQSVEDPKAVQAKPTPIPKVQLGVITAMRLVEPIAYTQIFPYINEFMNDLHVTDDPKRIGFYSGMVQSTFAVFELASIYNMAKLSDRVGRRPVILCGITGVALTTLLLGLSTSFPMMIVVRAMAGLCAGNVAVMHSVVGELTDASNQAIALPFYGISWPLGSVIGPLLGGTFSHPAEKFSWLDWGLLRSHPYFLPCFISCLLTLLGVLIGYLVLEETLPSKRPQNVRSRSSTSSSASTLCDLAEPLKFAESLSTWTLLSDPIIFALSTSGLALSFLGSGFEVVFVLCCYTGVMNGGLGLSTEQIGHSLSVSGVVALALQLVLLPYIMRTFNHAKAYNFCMCMFPCMFFLLSFLNPIARSGFDEATGLMDPRTTAIVWAAIFLVLSMSRIANLAYAFSMVLVKDSAPNPASLGMCNGIVQSVMCLARAISPAFVSSIYALSMDHEIMGGFAWVPVMLLILLAGVYQSATIARARSSKN